MGAVISATFLSIANNWKFNLIREEFSRLWNSREATAGLVWLSQYHLKESRTHGSWTCQSGKCYFLNPQVLTPKRRCRLCINGVALAPALAKQKALGYLGQDTGHHFINWLASLRPNKPTPNSEVDSFNCPSLSAAQSNRRHDVLKQHLGKGVLSIIQAQQSHK